MLLGGKRPPCSIEPPLCALESAVVNDSLNVERAAVRRQWIAFFDESDAPAGTNERERRSAAAGPGADDDHIREIVERCHRSSSGVQKLNRQCAAARPLLQ